MYVLEINMYLVKFFIVYVGLYDFMIFMDLIILVICSSGCNGCGNCIVFEVCSCNSGYIGNVC